RWRLRAGAVACRSFARNDRAVGTKIVHPFAEMLGLADSLGKTPIGASDKRLLRQIIVPSIDQQRQFGPRGEPFVQRGWLGRRREGVVHRRDDGLSMFEVLDILSRS